MNRNIFPSMAITLALLGLFGTATATDRARPDGFDEISIGIEGPTLGRGISPTGMPHATMGASKATNPEQAREFGVDWLVKAQHTDGGWGAGSWGQDNLSAPADVATTAYVTLALVRDAKGTKKNADAIHKGVEFVVRAVETAPAGTRLNTPEGTQPQYKLGQLVDTHFAALLFSEVHNTLPGELNHRVGVAWDEVISKVQLAQNSDGSFDSNGWAPVLSSSIAAQSLSRASIAGRDVDQSVMDKSDKYQSKVAGDGTGSFSSSEGAGVELYAVASGMRGNGAAAERERKKGKPTSEAAKVAEGNTQAGASRVTSDADGRLFSGFGSIGGEEMLSYQMISDQLAEQGGDDWEKWEEKVGGFMVGSQNADGSWSGHHCITSTVFVTAGAVMTLSAGDGAQLRAARDAASDAG